MTTFTEYARRRDGQPGNQTPEGDDPISEEWLGKVWGFLSRIATTASAAAGAVSLGQVAGVDIDQMDQMGIGVEQIADFIKRAKLTAEQIKILDSLREEMTRRLRDKCHADLDRFRGTADWLKEKRDSAEACDKYCKLKKDPKACGKSGKMVYDFGRYKRVARNPFPKKSRPANHMERQA